MQSALLVGRGGNGVLVVDVALAAAGGDADAAGADAAGRRLKIGLAGAEVSGKKEKLILTCAMFCTYIVNTTYL